MYSADQSANAARFGHQGGLGVDQGVVEIAGQQDTVKFSHGGLLSLGGMEAPAAEKGGGRRMAG